MPLFGLTAEEEREATARLMSLLMGGSTDDDARMIMGLTVAQYEQLKAKLFEDEAEKIRQKPSEHVYIEYMVNQLSCVKDLGKMVDAFRKTKQYNAMVGAVKARSEIYDKLIKKGQELGLIAKEPERQEIIGGQTVINLTNVELKKTIVAEIQGINRLMKAYGEGSILDLEPGELHRSMPKVKAQDMKKLPPKKPQKKGAPHPNAKVYKGRKVVKGKK